MYIEADELHNISIQKQDAILDNIYLARVDTIQKNINAAFLTYDKGKRCYLALDQFHKGKNFNRPTVKNGDFIPVQIIRDAIKTKEPVCSLNLSIPGSYCVVTLSGKGTIHFSKRIRDDVQKELRESIHARSEYGIIIRTSVNELLDRRALNDEIEQLTAKMNQIFQKASNTTGLSLLYQAAPEYLSFTDEMLRLGAEKIVTDEPELYHSVMEHFSNMCSKPEITFYQDEMSFFKLYSLQSKIEQALSKKVWLKSGATIIIEITEAMTVIDVNTGKNCKRDAKENIIFQINMEAARMICRQITLRNLSGIIIIDFINMSLPEHIDALTVFMKTELKKDTVKTDFIDMTALGLMEITREKIKKTLYEQID